MKPRPFFERDRRGIGTVAFVVIGVAIIIVAAAVAVELAGTRPASSNSVQGPVTAAAKWMDASGNYVTNATLKLGGELKLSVTVTSGTQPIAVHMVYKGNVYRDHPWNTNATQYNFIIDSGPADVTDLGRNVAYAVVSFQDGSLVESNNATLTVTR